MFLACLKVSEFEAAERLNFGTCNYANCVGSASVTSYALLTRKIKALTISFERISVSNTRMRDSTIISNFVGLSQLSVILHKCVPCLHKYEQRYSINHLSKH